MTCGQYTSGGGGRTLGGMSTRLVQELLAQGRPREALALAQALPSGEGALLVAAAALRLGDTFTAQAALAALPASARRAVLLARAAGLLEAPSALDLAENARTLARQEGDAPALVAAVTLLAERQLLTGAERFLPLRTLAEGLKVAELTGQEADAHLLAVLAVAQRLSPRKAAQTAAKALSRAQAGSPAQVGALLLLGEQAQAAQQQQAGELADGWLRVFRDV